MSITYAGVPLLLEDPGHEFQTWLDQVLSLEDMRLWGDTTATEKAKQWQPAGRQGLRLGLPTVNWPAPPRMKLNSLWWPTGATRWARGLFLCSQDQLTKIQAAADVINGKPATLKLTEDQDGGREIQAEMYLLSPRPVTLYDPTKDDGTDPPQLWLLPMVDARYFWQWQAVGDLSQVQTWDDLIGEIEDALDITTEGLTSSDTGSASNLGKPDTTELCRSFGNAAEILDATAWSLGARIVYALDDTVIFVRCEDSKTKLKEDNLVQNVGGSSIIDRRFNTVQSQYQIAFPLYWNGKHKPQYGCYNSRASGVGNDKKQVPGTQDQADILTLWDTSAALYTGSSDPATTVVVPDNKSDLDNLATTFLSYLTNWDWCHYDFNYPGIHDKWTITGFDDFVWWHFGTQGPLQHQLDGDELERPMMGDYMVFTRIASLPPNVGMSVLFHNGGPEDAGDLIRVKLTSDLYECSDAAGVIMLFGSGSGSSSESNPNGSACCDTYTEGARVSVRDQLGVVSGSTLSQRSWDGKKFVALGTCVYAKEVSDNPKTRYEVVAIGHCLCQSSSSSDISTLSNASVASSKSSSSKSTAIVPANWSLTGYTALFVEESPEVRFDDIVEISTTQADFEVPIDRKYVEVCEPGTIRVCGCVPDAPVVIGACVENEQILLRFAKQKQSSSVRLTIRLTAIRKGFAGTRFPDRTREQFEANERFIRSAYNGK